MYIVIFAKLCPVVEEHADKPGVGPAAAVSPAVPGSLL
jgi:hypothetical protein